jgi:hypothetical protein
MKSNSFSLGSFWLSLLWAGLNCIVQPISFGQESEGGLDFFETNIRPVLVEHCYRCHNSIDLAEGSLVLDTRAGTLKGGDNGSIVEPGNAKESRLIAILKHEVPGLEMPEDGQKLSDSIIANFEKWISLGAPDPRNEAPTAETIQALRSWDKVLQERKKESWAFQPIRSPAVPEVNQPRWASHAVDRFAYHKMMAKGLTPGNRGDNASLVRRLFFVLIGLPPSSEEIRHWSKEIETKEGYARLVQTLLDRPQFGERWARHWMDWTRYADSHGSEGDPGIDNAWYYRDYLIRSLNADVPYAQMVREHIAGDLLPEPRINQELGINESLIATAHWRMVFHGFSPTDALDEKVRFIDDQVNTFSKAFLGVTLSCARCHHHKFDPISQEDYYATFGVFASCRPGRHAVDIDTSEPDKRKQLVGLKEKIKKEIAERWLAVIRSITSTAMADADKWSEIKDPADVRFPMGNLLRRVRAGEAFDVVWKDECFKHEMHRMAVEKYATDGAIRRWKFSDTTSEEQWYFEGKGIANKTTGPGEFSVAAEGDNLLTGLYPAGVYSHLLSSKDPARLTTEDVKLEDKYQIWMRVQGDGSAQTRYVVQDYPRNGVVFPTASIGPKWHWQKFDVAYWQGDDIHLELATGRDAPLLVNGSNRSWFGISETLILPADKPGPPEPLSQQTGFYRYAIAKMPKSTEEVIAAYWQGLAESVERWRDGRCDDIDAYWLGAALESQQLFNSVAADETLADLVREYRRIEAEIKIPIRVPGLDETVGRQQELYVRGNHKQLGAKVPRRFLQAVDATPYPTDQSGRLQLAEDLLRADNPLTYRVIVNRVWHHLFGRGLVLTTDNFGKLGSLPSDPDLLDHLASDFRDNKKGSFKQLIRELVMSEVWQLSSRPSDEALERDPENEFLTHANLRRLEAESIRDTLLSISGLLNGDMFGPPIDSNVPRRSVYMRVQRNALDPLLRAFDFPEPFSCTGRRDVTNVPAQSLAFMNDKGVTGWAASWASSILNDSKFSDDTSRLQEMFLAVTGRLPTTKELESLQSFLVETEQEQRRLIEVVREKSERAELLRVEMAKLLDPAREKLIEKMLSDRGKEASATASLQPIVRWEFKENLLDKMEGIPLTLQDGAKHESDHVIVGPAGYAVSEPLKKDLRAKTLEAWVQLDNLDQQGGGVLSVQTRDGNVFDAIVFGEQQRQHWLAGSNGFERTRAFGGYDDTEANNSVVHLAISYHPDGRIVGYRNGKPYGNEYQSNGPVLFRAGESVVGIGVRHLPAQGNRLLSGKIFRAQLYDRALTAEEVEASFHGFPAAITTATIIASLGDEDRANVERYQGELQALRIELAQYEAVPKEFVPQNSWTELARALFSLKETIFIP